ncbi:hypothetical protein [Arachidicoccus ginsenosidimutans]|nr:hypothetical protein [Arachidicoccus sp. BS20]
MFDILQEDVVDNNAYFQVLINNILKLFYAKVISKELDYKIGYKK